ncbi:MAG TPA: hypothetical protein P5044_05785 [bacterium]|nr:hypothetical protein [bacterium]
MKLLLVIVMTLFLVSCSGDAVNSAASGSRDTLVTEMSCAASQFSPDSRYIAWGGEKFKGLFVKDLTSGTITKISDADGAGWKFSWAPDSSGIAFRESITSGSDQFFRIQKRYLDKNMNELVGEFENTVWPPLWRDSIYSVDTVKISNISLALKPSLSLKTAVDPLKYNAFTSSGRVSIINIQDGSLINFNDGTHSPSISPDGRKLLYIELDTIKVYDTISASTVTIGRGSSASWAGNSRIVYTFTADDGRNVTYSEVRVFDLKNRRSEAIPVEAGRIPLFPSLSSNGSLAYTDSVSGRLFITSANDNGGVK